MKKKGKDPILDLVGIASGPSDASEKHDKYIYGRNKKGRNKVIKNDSLWAIAGIDKSKKGLKNLSEKHDETLYGNREKNFSAVKRIQEKLQGVPEKNWVKQFQKQ